MNRGLNQQKASEELLAWTAKHDKKSLIKILQRNGVNISDDATVNEVNIASLAALRSKTFQRDLSQLLGKNAIDNASAFSTDRVYGVSALDELSGASDPAPTTGNASASASTGTKSNVGGFIKTNVLTPTNIQAFISTGLNVLNTSLANKRESMAQKTAELQYMQQTTYQQPTGQAPVTAAGGSKTMMFVWIGLGVVVVGTGLYFALRKKK